MDTTELSKYSNDELAKARSILKKAEDENRLATSYELERIESHVEAAEAAKRTVEGRKADDVRRRVADLSAAGPGKSGLLAAFRAAGWEPGRKTTIPAEVGVKGASFDGNIDDLSPLRHEGAPLGADRRYLYPVFPAQSVGADVTSVQVVSASARALPDPLTSSGGGPMVRDIDDTSTKPEAETTRSLDTLPMKQVAAVETGIPNILLLQPGFRTTVDVDLRLAYEAALDALVVDAITNAGPDSSDDGDDLTEAIVYAAAQMAAAGYTGTVVALSPTDYAGIALLRGADEQFARSDPLAPFRFVQSVAVTTPLLIDPSAIGRLYISAVSLQSFEENAGATNSATVRYEGNAAAHIERSDAVLEITAAPSS